jgi:hypothetical protein
MNGEEIIPTFSTSNINIGQCLLKPLTLAHLQSYKFFRKNQSIGDRGILSFPLLRDAFLHRLARGIPPKEGVQYPLQSLVRTPTPHLR